jgi:hypothetical protein
MGDIRAIPIDDHGVPIYFRRSTTAPANQGTPVHHVIFIPESQPRNKGEQARSVAVATLVTPFVFAADIVVTPVVAAIFAEMGRQGG